MCADAWFVSSQSLLRVSSLPLAPEDRVRPVGAVGTKGGRLGGWMVISAAFPKVRSPGVPGVSFSLQPWMR